MNAISIIKHLTSFPSRVGPDEQAARAYLLQLLSDARVPFQVQTFMSQHPVYREARLVADGRNIPCLGTGLSSGTVTKADVLISSVDNLDSQQDAPNINYNPHTDAICVCSYYTSPALAVSRKDVPLLCAAASITGVVQVEAEPYESANILIGNLENPTTIVFTHYDGYFHGAVDNASGTGVTLDVAIHHLEVHASTLFVIAGNEEISFDRPWYWGRGYRQFATAYRRQMQRACSILVVDGLGKLEPYVEHDPFLLHLAFPITEIIDVRVKTRIITTNFTDMLPIYHSPDDTFDNLNPALLRKGTELLMTLLHP